MGFDALVTNPGRLRILTTLASAEDRQSFVEVRRRTGLTDGNLATHARRLQSAGFIAIEKSINAGKPLTTLHLTRTGREALETHARQLRAALDGPAKPQADGWNEPSVDSTDDWVD
jgi:DNA-binding MarR family transcriptional regulator